jgi:hypothetical protein
MTDPFDDAARALETRDVLRGEFELNGESYPLETLEPTLGEIEELEAELGDETDELEQIREFVDSYLEAPAVNPDDLGLSKLRALFEGMREAWNNMDTIEDAEEAMPVESGNRRTSRR